MDFLLNVVAISSDRESDWDAAARRIDALVLGDLDRFFGYWDHDGGSREEAADDDAYVPRLKGELRDELDNVRRSFDGSREAPRSSSTGSRELSVRVRFETTRQRG